MFHLHVIYFGAKTKASRMTFLFLIPVLLLCVGTLLAECPRYQVPHTVGFTTRCCHPVFNCEKGHEIKFCLEDGGTDTCVPCGNGAINLFVTSSLGTKRHVCFNKTKSHEDCPIEDNFPTAENEFCKDMYCSCKTEDCRYGDPCIICQKRRTPCGINEEINAKTGECEPCHSLMYSPAGCGPCLYNETAWRLTQGGSATMDASSSQNETTKITKPVVTKVEPSSLSTQDGTRDGETGYNIATEKPNNSSTEQAQENGEDGFSMTPVIIVIAILVFIGIIVALILYIKKKIKDGDENSRLVVCYKSICRGNIYRRGTNQPDAEAVPQNGDVPHQQNIYTDMRQTQAVPPMVRQTEPLDEASGGAECGAGAEMALLKDEDRPGNGIEETRQKET